MVYIIKFNKNDDFIFVLCALLPRFFYKNMTTKFEHIGILLIMNYKNEAL